MKVLTVAERFPAWHFRAGEFTEFDEKILEGEKLHTCRENLNGYYKTGDVVSLRGWIGKPRRSKQITIRDGVRITVLPIAISMFGGVIINDSWVPDFETFAKNDGLSVLDAAGWFFGKKNKLQRVIWAGSIIFFNDGLERSGYGRM